VEVLAPRYKKTIAIQRNPTVSARLTLPAQTVDATPSSHLIRQHFTVENRFVLLYSIRP